MVRSESTASQSPEAVKAPAKPVVPQIVPIEGTSDAMRAFASERGTSHHDKAIAPVSGPDATRVSVLPAEPKPHAIRDVSPAPVARLVGWRNVALALLAALVVVQTGLIAVWLWPRGVAAAPTETGSLSITSEPSGSRAAIDGVDRGITPLTVSLTPGTHRVDVGTGGQLRSQNMTISRGGNASMHVELPLPAPPGLTAGLGSLQISTEPGGARVWVDGEARGVAPVTVANLKAGDHAVTVRSGNGEPVNRTVTVQEGAVASLIISINRTSAFASGWLAITSSVPLHILEKGQLLGTTDMPRILMPAGSHELELTNTDLGYRVTRTVQIAAGQTESFALKPPMGSLSVNALPWAEVWVDGQRAGETPIGNYSITIGSHELLFRHPELGEQRRTVNVGAGAPVRVGVDMRR